jgi:hypothetical protein
MNHTSILFSCYNNGYCMPYCMPLKQPPTGKNKEQQMTGKH